MEEYREMTSETVDRVEMAEALRILQKLKGERLSHVRFENLRQASDGLVHGRTVPSCLPSADRERSDECFRREIPCAEAAVSAGGNACLSTP